MDRWATWPVGCDRRGSQYLTNGQLDSSLKVWFRLFGFFHAVFGASFAVRSWCVWLYQDRSLWRGDEMKCSLGDICILMSCIFFSVSAADVVSATVNTLEVSDLRFSGSDTEYGDALAATMDSVASVNGYRPATKLTACEAGWPRRLTSDYAHRLSVSRRYYARPRDVYASSGKSNGRLGYGSPYELPTRQSTSVLKGRTPNHAFSSQLSERKRGNGWKK